MSDPSNKLLLAQIGPPHGVKGLMRLKSFTEDPDAVFDYGPLTNDRGEVVPLKRQSRAKGMLLVAMEGISDRDAAAALKGTRLYVSRDRLPEPDEDEFYQTDLIGLDCYLNDDTPFGEIKAIQNFGGGDLLEIKPSAGGPTVFIPFTREAVPTVSLSTSRVTVVPPESIGDPETGTERADP